MTQNTTVERVAQNATDETLTRLMWTMVERGQKASRKGDADAVATFQAAYDTYHAEAVRRGLTA